MGATCRFTQNAMSGATFVRIADYDKFLSVLNINSCIFKFTLIPVLVASFTAASKLSYLGLNDTVKALSIILPEKPKQKTLKS